METSQKLVGGASARAALLTLIGMSALLVAPKCGSDVVVPAEDPTPPLVRLFTVHDDKTFEVPAEGARIVVPAGDRFGVFVEGKDPSGMRRVTISSLGEASCAAGTQAESRREDVVHTELNELEPGEIGSTQLFTSVAIDAGLSCASGLAPRSKTFRVVGVAENYHGGVTTTPTLTIVVDVKAKPEKPEK